MESLVPEYDLLGHVRERSGGALPGIAPSNTYPSEDGGYVVIAGNSDPIFRRLMQVIGRPDLADDPALAQNDGRAAQSTMLDQAIAAWTSHHTTDDILAALEQAQVPAGRIYSIADIVADPHYQAREMLLQANLPDGTAIKMPGIVPKLSDTPGEVRWQGPTLGEHTGSVLASLGFDAGEIDRLRSEGAVQ
jgi:crotonobetainyl-CoA:carnitine CoA-transferase CaiB-like acyl-CoA transferase